MVPVECYFVLSALLFFIGVYGFVSRRNLIAMLISVELVLNAVEINFAAFNRLLFPGQLEGFFFSLFSHCVRGISLGPIPRRSAPRLRLQLQRLWRQQESPLQHRRPRG